MEYLIGYAAISVGVTVWVVQRDWIKRKQTIGTTLVVLLLWPFMLLNSLVDVQINRQAKP